jgi:SAM-dependent methyltransferase
MKQSRSPLSLLFAALFGIVIGVSIGRLSSFSCPGAPLLGAQRSKLIVETEIAPLAPPTTIEQARKNLATALVHAWDLNRDAELWSNSRGGVSAPRVLLNNFILELSKQLGTSASLGTCMDWSRDYISGFPACKTKYDFAFSEQDPIFREAGEDVERNLFGLIQGDLGEDMTHVPEKLLDFAIITQVFEHVPHFWNAMPNLKRLMAPGGLVVFTAPFAYQFHPYPGDFYRYSPMAMIHMFESSGFAVCQIVSSGWRSVQMHALGLEMPDIEGKGEYLTKQRSFHSLIIGASDYYLVAQRVEPGSQGCTLERLHLSNEILVDDIKAYANNFWPHPMPNFPLPKSLSRKISVD